MSITESNLLKIAIVGPESTGKSTMANYLADKLGSICVPEYSRYYCANLKKNYTLQDEVNMFYGQLALEEALIPLAKNNLIFCDVTIMTIKIWCDHLFQHTPEEVLTEISTRQYDLYLLMDIDLPWEDDPLRDFPGQREHFMKIWKNELNTVQANYKIVSGLGDQRFLNALAICNQFLQSKNYISSTILEK